MRCVSCNTILTDKEATRKSPITFEYLDMCNVCLGSIAADIPNSVDDPEFWDYDDEFVDESHELD